MGKHDEAVERHQKLVEKSNQRLAQRKEEADKDTAAKLKEHRAAITKSISSEYAGRFKKQEERFQKRCKEDNARIRRLEESNANLRSQARRAQDTRRRAEEARERAEQDLASLMADMAEMNAQVAPIVERAEEAEKSVQTALVLTQQRERMFRSLVTRGNALAEKLGVASPAVPLDGNSDATAYLAFFDKLFTALEGGVAEVDNLVDEECLKLLTVAIERIFSNLRRLNLGFDFETVTEPIEDDLTVDLSNSVRDEVNDYVNRFKRVEADEAPEEEEGTDEEAEEGGDA